MSKRIDVTILIIFTFLGQIIGIGSVNVDLFQDCENNDNVLEITNFNPHSATTEVIIPSVPHYYQARNYWCGPASLEMVYDFYGPDIPQLEIADVARSKSSYGTYASDLRRATHFSKLSTSVGMEMQGNITGYPNRPIGYGAFTAHLPNVNSLVNLIDNGFPIVVLQWFNTDYDSGHFRVVIGYVKTVLSIKSIITHDPWSTPGGPNYHIDYSTFVNLWTRYNNWALFICPWKITVSCSSIVKINSTFTVRANVEYLCPSYLTPEYPASTCKATIQLPTGFSLAPGENYTKNLNPVVLQAGNIGITTWDVTANILDYEEFITVNASGIISGTASYIDPNYPEYNYSDLIGGEGSKLVKVVKELPKDNIIIPITIAVGSAVVIGVVMIFIIWRIRRKAPE